MYPEAGWQFEKIKREDEVINYHLYHQSPLPMFIAEVDLGKIVGTDHSNFNTGNWIKMRDTLFKKSTNEKYVAMVRDNPDHSEGLDPITVKQYGEEYILCQSGNHRVCHAKFTGFLTIRVRVLQHLIDLSLVGKPIKPQMEAIPIRLIKY